MGLAINDHLKGKKELCTFSHGFDHARHWAPYNSGAAPQSGLVTTLSATIFLSWGALAIV